MDLMVNSCSEIAKCSNASDFGSQIQEALKTQGYHTTSCHTLPMKSDNLMFTPRRLQQGKVATISSRYLFRPSLGMVLAVQAAPLWNYNYT